MDYTRNEMQDLAFTANLAYAGHAKSVDSVARTVDSLQKLAALQKDYAASCALMLLANSLSDTHGKLVAFNGHHEQLLTFVETMADRAEAPPSPNHETILSQFSRSVDVQRDIWLGKYS